MWRETNVLLSYAPNTTKADNAGCSDFGPQVSAAPPDKGRRANDYIMIVFFVPYKLKIVGFCLQLLVFCGGVT